MKGLQSKRGVGRVRLAEFYAAHNASGSGRRHHYPPALLRQQGVLDESDPADPHIIASNFVAMPMHCRNMSKYFTLCCADMCEVLYGALEEAIDAPDATPAEILGNLSVIE